MNNKILNKLNTVQIKNGFFKEFYFYNFYHYILESIILRFFMVLKIFQ